jgi:hypothetical protein
MGKFYDVASDEVRNRVTALIERFHPDLKASGLTLDLLWAKSEDDSPAVMLHGYACLAVVRITNAKERTAGRADSEIVIDKERYEKLSELSRDALLDHELFHLTCAKDKFGAFKIDEHHRPLLKMRLHDREFGWFDAIASRHGEHAMEVIQARLFAKDAGQVYFGFDAGAQVPKTSAASVGA